MQIFLKIHQAKKKKNHRAVLFLRANEALQIYYFSIRSKYETVCFILLVSYSSSPINKSYLEETMSGKYCISVCN